MSFITANSKTAKGCDRSVNYFKISPSSKDLGEASYIIAGNDNSSQLEMFVADNLDIYFFKVGSSGSNKGQKFEVNRNDFFRLIGEYFFHENLNMHNVISDFVIDKRGEKIKMSFIFSPEQQGDIPAAKDAELTPSQFYNGMLLMLENYALSKKHEKLKKEHKELESISKSLENAVDDAKFFFQKIGFTDLIDSLNSSAEKKKTFDKNKSST